jgi:predicted DCC family thiol-disulfide oxidoreductase YuxK
MARPLGRSGRSERVASVWSVARDADWVVLYDADCGLCQWLLAGLLRWDRSIRLRPVALQAAEAEELLRDVPPAERMASWHLVSPAGTRRSAGGALAPLLRLLPGGRIPATVFARFPRLTDRGYRWVADHRTRLSAWVPASFKRGAGKRVRERELALGAITPSPGPSTPAGPG